MIRLAIPDALEIALARHAADADSIHYGEFAD